MLTGSTSGLRSLPALSSRLPCWLVRNPALFVRGYFVATPLHKRFSTTSRHPKVVLEELNTAGGHDAPPTNNYPSFGSHFPTVSANGIPRMGCPPVSSDKNHLVGVDSLSDSQDHWQHGVPHRAPNRTKRKCPAQRRRTLLWIMLTAKTPDRAWAAYEELLGYRAAVPNHLLHQLARLLASIKPRTRTVHLQLLSVLRTLKRNHGRLRLWEWNTLIDSVGKQWHKTSLQDYENALDLFNERGVLPAGSTASTDGAVDAAATSCVTQQNPDIWTYNVLLSIATRTNLPHAVRHASSLLLASGLTPNRHTHLCLLRYFTVRNDLRSVCSTLRKMKEQDLEVGLDGINACLWAYAWDGRFDVALPIYRLLRNHVSPTPDLGEYDIEEDVRYICETVGLDIPDGYEPNEITYTMMIQALAYHGDLRNALGVFVDMLSTRNCESLTRTGDTSLPPACFKPSMRAFRGLFLGFSRHGREAVHPTVELESVVRLFPSSQGSWGLGTLETIFAAFLQLPSLPKPTDGLIYWILVAFDKTSGNDSEKLREVWTKLEAKYGGGWGGRLEEIRRSIFPSE